MRDSPEGRVRRCNPSWTLPTDVEAAGSCSCTAQAPETLQSASQRSTGTGPPSSTATGASSGSAPVQLGPLEIAASSGGSASGEDSWSYLHGNVGSEIGGVVIALADGTNITASLGGGRFAAWWPGEVVATRIRGFDRAGNQVANEPN